MMPFNIVTWTADPVLFSIDLGSFHFQLRWYALMFIIGFYLGIKIMERIYKREGLNPERVYTLFMYCFIGTLVGARLGHCLFYDPDYYLAHPVEILKTWKGGLASHGGTIGVITAVLIYAHRDKLGKLWILDRLSIAVAPVAALIRMGNLFNHEIFGHATALPWGFRFIENIGQWERGADPIFTDPSHPTQIYEALAYLLTFAFLLWLYFKTDSARRPGLLFGVFLLGIFATRLLIEFVKNVQEAFEEGMLLNMGQLLSLPFILLGAWFVMRALKRPQEKSQSPTQKERVQVRL
jgi:prolipoprotein diacylglyceryl transferase